MFFEKIFGITYLSLLSPFRRMAVERSCKPHRQFDESICLGLCFTNAKDLINRRLYASHGLPRKGHETQGGTNGIEPLTTESLKLKRKLLYESLCMIHFCALPTELRPAYKGDSHHPVFYPTLIQLYLSELITLFIASIGVIPIQDNTCLNTVVDWPEQS